MATTFCPHCEKFMASRCHLKMHISAVHLKERNFKCGLCTMTFVTKVDLNKHKKHHLAETNSDSTTIIDTDDLSEDIPIFNDE